MDDSEGNVAEKNLYPFDDIGSQFAYNNFTDKVIQPINESTYSVFPVLHSNLIFMN